MKVNTIQVLYLGSLFGLQLNGVEDSPVPQNIQRFKNSLGGVQHNINSGINSRMDVMNAPVGSPRRLNKQATPRSLNSQLNHVVDYEGPIDDDYGGEIDPNESRWGIGSFLKFNPTIIKPKIPINIPGLNNLGQVIASNGGTQVVANSAESNGGVEGMPNSVISGSSVIGFGLGKTKTTTRGPNS
ncbi:hypothetical protein CONCODRAFT_7641, partial [Conidiobolus coronatus NRRL 28638]